MNDAARPSVLSEETARRVAGLRVRARTVVEGLRSGMHRSPHRGASVIFAEHRDYRPGDDLRLLDWRAFARNDRYAIKHFEQETHLRAHLVLDRSSSMDYGGSETDLHKGDYAAGLLAAMAFILLGQGDAVGAHVLNTSLATELPARSRPDHLDALLGVLSARPDTGKKTDLRHSLQTLAERIGRRSMVILASDLLDFDERALEPLNMLRARGHDVLVFHVLHEDELRLPFDERVRFIDLEDESSLDVDTGHLQAEYKKQFDAFLDSCRRRCIGAGARYALATTGRSPQQVIAGALNIQGSGRWV